jgi:hypothetical protein
VKQSRLGKWTARVHRFLNAWQFQYLLLAVVTCQMLIAFWEAPAARDSQFEPYNGYIRLPHASTNYLPLRLLCCLWRVLWWMGGSDRFWNLLYVEVACLIFYFAYDALGMFDYGSYASPTSCLPAFLPAGCCSLNALLLLCLCAHSKYFSEPRMAATFLVHVVRVTLRGL